MKALVLLTILLWTSSVHAEAAFDNRRFVLVIMAISEAGDVAPIDFQNNTFTTDANCRKAGEKLVQRFGGNRTRSQLVFECLDRGSAV